MFFSKSEIEDSGLSEDGYPYYYVNIFNFDSNNDIYYSNLALNSLENLLHFSEPSKTTKILTDILPGAVIVRLPSSAILISFSTFSSDPGFT